jgi:hypothetical protein
MIAVGWFPMPDFKVDQMLMMHSGDMHARARPLCHVLLLSPH